MQGDFWPTLVIIAAAFLLLFPLLRFLLKPMKLVGKVLLNGLTGFVLLWLINTFAGPLGFFLPVNLVTIAVAGFLGLPGILFLTAMKLFLAY